MSDKKYKRKYEFQKKMISRQSEQIEDLKSQIERLNLQIQEKNNIINSVDSLRSELMANVDDTKKYKEEYRELVNELRKMKEILNVDVYKGCWRLIKFLIR